jgi:hypothetical protein
VLQLHSDNLSNMMCVSQGKHIYHCLSCIIQCLFCHVPEHVSCQGMCWQMYVSIW